MNTIKQAIEFVGDIPYSKLKKTHLEDIYHFFCQRKYRGKTISSGTLHLKMIALKQFVAFCMGEGLTNVVPNDVPCPPKGTKRRIVYLSREQIEQTLRNTEIVQENRLLQLRDRAMFLFLYSTGFRVSEMLYTKRSSIRDNIAYTIGKGQKNRQGFVNEAAQKALDEYTEELHKLFHLAGLRIPDEIRFSFPRSRRIPTRDIARHLLPLKKEAVHSICEKYGKLLNLPYTLGPHVFRHTFATHLIQAGVDLKVISELLGHSSVLVTEMYAHLSNKELLRAHSLIRI